jgi:DNA polymerase (family X)
MMTNKEIANTFNDLGRIMELHGENPFKIRSYSNAYLSLRKLEIPLNEMEDEELADIKGIGKTIVSKIRELEQTGSLEALDKYKAMTPVGVQEMLKIKGFGPKKVRVIWKDLGAESIGELLYACNENRLVELNGFGQKTQEDLKNKLVYFLNSKNKFLYASLESIANDLKMRLQKSLPDAKIEFSGGLRRCNPILESIELIIATSENISKKIAKLLSVENEEDTFIQARTETNIPVIIYKCSIDNFGSKQFRYTGGQAFIKSFLEKNVGGDFRNLKTEEEVFAKVNLPFIAPELRDWEDALAWGAKDNIPTLIDESDIKGVIHSHTTYSDGLHSLRTMAEYAKEQGFDYIGITDHSKSAFYANGLKPDRVYQQMEEIDQLNLELAPFKIFKGIESDILNDGALDYEEEVLGAFDFIIASVHSNLKMDEAKATHRIITAVENPYTTMLGHPTSRLLLSREGYPLDHKKVIDACAANGVVIELNANPYRLDLDWTWIPYALEKGVKIAINPDAHSKEGIHDIHFGVLAARKGGLSKEECVNCLTTAEFEKYLSK